MADRHHAAAMYNHGQSESQPWSRHKPHIYSSAANLPPPPSVANHGHRWVLDRRPRSPPRNGEVKFERGPRPSLQPSEESVEDGGARSSDKARKRRIHYSCDECHRRKQKCNRQLPCQHCCTRGVPHLCKFSATQEAQEQSNALHVASFAEPSSSRASMDNNKATPDATLELRELKEMVHDGFAEILRVCRTSARNGFVGTLSPSVLSAPNVLGKRRNTEDHGLGQDDLYINHSAAVSSSKGSKLLGMLSMQNAAKEFDPTRSIDARTSIDEVLVDISSRDIRGTGPMSSGLLSCLPSAEETERLFEVFMKDRETSRITISTDSVRRCMARLPAILERGQIAVEEISSYGVITAVLSLAVHKADEEESRAHEYASKHRQARALLFASIKCLTTCDILGQMDTAKCLGHHLASRILVLDRRLNEAYMCAGSGVRCAQALGLHRIDPTARNRPAWQLEEERLLWCAIRSDERSTSILTERPSCIDDRICHTTPPAPSATLLPDTAAFVQFRHDLASLQGQMIILLQRQHAPQGIPVREILALDEELTSFGQLLPSDDMRRTETYAQRFSIHSHVLQTRLALLRPFFLRSIPKNASAQLRQAYSNCRRACVEAACQDLTLRENLVRHAGGLNDEKGVPGYIRRSIRTPRWFTSLIICGAYLLIGNRQSEADSRGDPLADERMMMDKARQHLHTFIELAEDRQRREGQRDVALDREVAILRMFLEKSSEKAVARLKSQSKKQRLNADDLGRQLYADTASAQTVQRSNASEPHSTPPSMTSPAGSGGSKDTHDRTRSSSAQSGEDLQAILDAWFQAGSNLGNAGFAVSSALDACADTNGMGSVIDGAAGHLSSVALPSVGSPSESHMAAGMYQQAPQHGPGNLAVSFASQDKVSIAAHSGEFWQGFINMLSGPSHHVH